MAPQMKITLELITAKGTYIHDVKTNLLAGNDKGEHSIPYKRNL
jgi:hypothetical protein